MPRQLPDLLRAYGEFTSRSDSPQVFHLWGALVTIAGAAQRKIFFPFAYYEIHTNLYVFLVSPPGRAKKGAALRVSKNLLKDIEPQVNFATESSSVEGLIGIMAKIQNPAHQSLSLYSMELGTLMSTAPERMVDFLTDIFDCNPGWARQTVTHSLQNLKRPWLSVMSGTNPAWLGEHMGMIALQGGLVARSLFPFSDERLLENSAPRLDAHLTEIRQALINDLSHIATLEGTFDFEGGEEGEAYLWFDAWYKDKDTEAYRTRVAPVYQSRFPSVEDPRTITYFDRKDILLLKIAMLLSLSYKDELVLTLEDLKRALALLDATEPGMRKALSSAGRNENATQVMAILSQIKSKKRMSYRDLLIENIHNLNKRQLDDVLWELQTMGKVRKEGQDFIYMGVA